MDDFDLLADDIGRAANIGQKEATGFYAVYCPVCNKNDRRTGGLKFEFDKIVYNCFRGRCDATCVYEKGERPSNRFKDLCRAMNVTIPPSILMVKSSLQKKIEKQLESDLFEKNQYDVSTFGDSCEWGLPDHWIDEFERRHVTTDRLLHITSGKFKGNVLIPMRLNGKVIGHTVKTSNGYVKLFGGNTDVIFAPSGKIDNTVIVVEGTMDAMCFPNTVSIMQNHISPKQAFHLRGKNVIMIPDRSGGNRFPEQFHKYGWKLCVPPWKEKDLNSAVVRYGILSCARMIGESLYTDRVKGQTAFKLWQKD